MTKCAQAIALVLLLALTASLVLAQVPNIAQFSADMKMSRSESDFATGKMYWAAAGCAWT